MLSEGLNVLSIGPITSPSPHRNPAGGITVLTALRMEGPGSSQSRGVWIPAATSGRADLNPAVRWNSA